MALTRWFFKRDICQISPYSKERHMSNLRQTSSVLEGHFVVFRAMKNDHLNWSAKLQSYPPVMTTKKKVCELENHHVMFKVIGEKIHQCVIVHGYL